MISLFKWLGGAIIIGLIFPLFYYLIITERPNVRYEISQGIPTTFASNGIDTCSYLQELNVQNYGNKKAENILVNVQDRITNFSILKNSQMDSVNVIRNIGVFEFYYKELVPGGKFRLLLKSGYPISNSLLNVYNSTGKCKQIERKSLAFYVGDLFIIVWGVILFSFLFSAIRYLFTSWKTSFSCSNIGTLIVKRKPLWVDKNLWNIEIQKAIISSIQQDSSFREIKESVSYTVLNYQGGSFLSGHFLSEVFLAAEKKLKDLILDTKSYYDRTQWNYRLKLSKPYNMDSEKWLGIQTDLQRMYVAYLKNETAQFSLPSTYEKELDNLSAYSIGSTLLKDYETYLKRNYIREILNENIFNQNHFYDSILNSNYKKYLNQSEQDKIESIAYKFQIVSFEYHLRINWPTTSIDSTANPWIKKEDLERLNRDIYNEVFQSMRILSKDEFFAKLANLPNNWLNKTDKDELLEQIENREKYYKGHQIFDSLMKILSGQYLLDERPSSISENDWKVLINIQSKVLEHKTQTQQ